MRLVVPHVAGILRDECRDSVLAGTPHAELIELDPEDDSAYPTLLVNLWAAGDDVTICEQDVVPPVGWLTEFDACPWTWCIYEPLLRPGVSWLGAVRFRAELMAVHPTAMVEAQAISDDGERPMVWRKADVRFERWMTERHITAHFHGPRAVHLHDHQAPPCLQARQDTLESPYGPRTITRVCRERTGHSGPHRDERGQLIPI